MGTEPAEIEIDITHELSAEQVDGLFAAFNDEDWAEVDRLIDGFPTGPDTAGEGKAGGADRNRGQAEVLRRYWTVGAGGQKIRWGTPGDWRRCVALLSEHLGPRAAGYCNQRHKEVNGFYPGDKRNLGKSLVGGSDHGFEYHTTKDDTGDSMLEFKTLGLQGVDVVSEEKGIVETIVSVTGVVDTVKDRIRPGAYVKSLTQRTPKGVWGHEWTTPVSRTLGAKELMPGDPELPSTMPNGDPWPPEAGALKIKTQFNLETQRGREAYSDVVFFGADSEWSVGYQVPVGGATVDSKTGIREIEVMDLYEYSPVLFGAMPLARTTSVKQAQLAYKALKSGAAPWLADAEVKEQPLPDATLADGDDGYLPVDQMILVKRAITTLTDLLSVVRGDVEMKEGPREEEPDEPEEDYDSLAAALEDLITDDDELNATLVEAAAPVDDAIDSGDVEALDSASTTFLDAVETEMNREDADKTLLSDLLVLFADMVENLPTPEPPSEENQETKRQYDQSARDEMAESGAAMPDGSFPIKDEADLRNAIQAVGRAKDPDAAKAHIKKRAKALGLEDLIPDSWTDSKVLLNTEEIAEFVRDSE